MTSKMKAIVYYYATQRFNNKCTVHSFTNTIARDTWCLHEPSGTRRSQLHSHRREDAQTIKTALCMGNVIYEGNAL
jgi:hypothetical protein